MIHTLRLKIANWIAPHDWPGVVHVDETLKNIDHLVNQRVAEAIMRMDPFEPFFRKFHVIFSEQYARPEDNLNSQGKILLYSWAYSNARDPSFKHLTEWIQNVQGNNTLRKATNDYEWFFGRCAVIMIELFVEQVGRLSRQYEEMASRSEERFDASLSVE